MEYKEAIKTMHKLGAESVSSKTFLHGERIWTVAYRDRLGIKRSYSQICSSEELVKRFRQSQERNQRTTRAIVGGR